MFRPFLQSFVYAFQGIVAAFREQRSLKFHILGALLVFGIGFYFEITAFEWIALVSMTGLVVGLEMMNTAIESLVDLVTLERKPLAGKVKDIAAGAVLIVSIGATVVLMIIFQKYFFPGR
jgi:diacylglycerol kinase